MNRGVDAASAVLDCPSSQPTIAGARVFGVVSRADADVRVAYLDQAVPVTPALLRRTGPVEPTKVLRIAAPCETTACPHFEGERCTLATKVAEVLPAAVDTLAPCPVRRTCRWFAQEGREICRRCAGVATTVDGPSEAMRFVTNVTTRLRRLPVVPA